MGRPERVGAPRAGPVQAARRTRALREPPSCQRAPGNRSILAAAAGAPRGRRPADSPRAHRRALLRCAPGSRRDQRRAIGKRHAAVLRARDRPDRPACVRAGPDPAQSRHQRRQGERPCHVAAVAPGCQRGRRGLPGRRAQPPARRFVRHAPREAPGRVRRARDREPLRRHPVGRGERARRLPRAAAVGVARGAAHRARHVRPVRADPRLRSAPRRPGPGQPDRDDPVGGDARPLVARTGGRRRGDRGRGLRGARRRAGGRRTSRASPIRPTGWWSSARPGSRPP